MAAAPLDEETERSLILSLVHELNNLFSTDLCEDPMIDRFLDEDVFYQEQGKKPSVILVGASHLNRIAERLDDSMWIVHNLCRPGFRITEKSVAEVTGQIEDLGRTLQLSECTAILQLYDNTVYQVGGPGGVRHLPTCDLQGRYHIDGTLQVADKPAIKEMTAMLSPLIKALGQA